MKYTATKEQIESLIKNSGHCLQEIKIGCRAMPLHYGKTNHAYWQDRNYRENHFFHGYDANSRRCKCSYEAGGWQSRGCLNDDVECNCDLRSKNPTEDYGIIGADYLLPITAFGYRFDGHSLDTFNGGVNASAQVQIGDIICGGS